MGVISPSRSKRAKSGTHSKGDSLLYPCSTTRCHDPRPSAPIRRQTHQSNAQDVQESRFPKKYLIRGKRRANVVSRSDPKPTRMLKPPEHRNWLDGNSPNVRKHFTIQPDHCYDVRQIWRHGGDRCPIEGHCDGHLGTVQPVSISVGRLIGPSVIFERL